MSFTYTVVPFGRAGQGKSTFLNYLLQSPYEAKYSPFFKPKFGGSSGTFDVSPPKTAKIYNTQQTVTVHDSPGSFALDMPLDLWLEKLKANLPQQFHALLWVLDITQRVQPSDAVLCKAMEEIFQNFSMERVIIVFTHCDRLSEENEVVNINDRVNTWLKLLKSSSQMKIDTRNIVLFGKPLNGYDNSGFLPSFVKALNEIPKTDYLAINAEIKRNQILMEMQRAADQKLAEERERERQRVEEERRQQEDARNREIEALRNRPPVHINHTTNVYVRRKRNGCTIF